MRDDARKKCVFTGEPFHWLHCFEWMCVWQKVRECLSLCGFLGLFRAGILVLVRNNRKTWSEPFAWKSQGEGMLYTFPPVGLQPLPINSTFQCLNQCNCSIHNAHFRFWWRESIDEKELLKIIAGGNNDDDENINEMIIMRGFNAYNAIHEMKYTFAFHRLKVSHIENVLWERFRDCEFIQNANWSEKGSLLAGGSTTEAISHERFSTPRGQFFNVQRQLMIPKKVRYIYILYFIVVIIINIPSIVVKIPPSDYSTE